MVGDANQNRKVQVRYTGEMQLVKRMAKIFLHSKMRANRKSQPQKIVRKEKATYRHLCYDFIFGVSEFQILFLFGVKSEKEK